MKKGEKRTVGLRVYRKPFMREVGQDVLSSWLVSASTGLRTKQAGATRELSLVNPFPLQCQLDPPTYTGSCAPLSSARSRSPIHPRMTSLEKTDAHVSTRSRVMQFPSAGHDRLQSCSPKQRSSFPKRSVVGLMQCHVLFRTESALWKDM